MNPYILHASTIGNRFVELEYMAGTTALGLLAIKNNITAFIHLLTLSDDTKRELSVQDMYGNTPLHYFALRGGAVFSYLEELGADGNMVNNGQQSAHAVLRSRRIVCKERPNEVGACYCASRCVVSVVP